jgi:putative transposase
VFFLDESGFGLSLPPTYAWARKGEAVREYLDRVAEGLAKPLKVFLDNAPFHRSRAFREAAGRWRERGLEVAYLPRYSPHLNPVEGVWRRVKGFLMPRRHYGSVEELRGAVAEALERLRERMGQGVLQGLCVGT